MEGAEIIGFDPSLSCTGFAIYDCAVGDFTELGILKVSNKFKGAARCRKMWESWDHAREFHTVLAEIQEFRGRGERAGTQQLMDLQSICMLFYLATKATHLRFGYPPRVWKKSIPKRIHHKRLLAKYIKNKEVQKYKDEPDALDAVGIVDYYLGSLKK